MQPPNTNPAPPFGSAADGRRWYLVQILPANEDRAEMNLRRQGFITFVPRQRKIVRHARQTIEKRVLFFPGYMFTAFHPLVQNWRVINGTFGVRSLVMQGRVPLPCPIGLVEGMIEVAQRDGLLDIPPDGVRIEASGSTWHAIAMFEPLTPSQRNQALLDMMGR